MDEKLREQIKKCEDAGNKVIYVTKSGSQLYGTNNENSDTDYMGLFIPSEESVLLKQDKPDFSLTTGDINSKNSKDDLDISLYSVYHFFNNIKKGETNSIDILFSMFSKSTVLSTKESEYIRDNYSNLLCSKTKAFTGYCVQQATKYGVKGTKYKQVSIFSLFFDSLDQDVTIKENMPKILEHIQHMKYKYIDIVKIDDNTYIDVIGKKYQDTMKTSDARQKIKALIDTFGSRTKSASEGTDWKSLSHAMRVLFEVKELLISGFITFPLLQSQYIKDIKYGQIDLDSVVDRIGEEMQQIEYLEDNTSLPKEADSEFIDKILLNLIKGNV